MKMKEIMFENEYLACSKKIIMIEFKNNKFICRHNYRFVLVSDNGMLTRTRGDV